MGKDVSGLTQNVSSSTPKKRHNYYSYAATWRAEAGFKRMLPRMGNIVKVCGDFDNSRWYRVRFINDKGQHFVMTGFAWWYGGAGPTALTNCLRMLGVSEDILTKLMVHDEMTRGDQYDPNCFFINLERTESNEVQ